MKKLHIPLILLVLATLSILACKKEVLTPQQFVQKQILGNWPLKYSIRTVYTNNIATKSDTLNKGLVIDTLVFSADGRVVKRNKIEISSTTYTIDVAGEHITFGTTPTTTQNIIYVRPMSIGLTTETTNGSVKTVVEDQLIK